jgi:hypothetical protein
MSNMFSGLSYAPLRRAQAVTVPARRHAAASLQAGSPGFLHAGFASLEPDLTHEVRLALGEQAALRAGDLP